MFTKDVVMVRFLPFLAILMCCEFINAQNVFDPRDSIVAYDSTAVIGTASNPVQPGLNVMSKWVRTKRLDWNTSNFKSYIWNGLQFRLRFPNNYDSANPAKYPVLIFYHGGGEIGSIYNNEDQLLLGAPLFEARINNNEWNGFMIFPQEPSIGWNDYQFSRINAVLDTLQKYNDADPDRVIVAGLSAGGYGALSHASSYPGRIAMAVTASPIQAISLIGNVKQWVHIPVWFANGGMDVNPNPNISQGFYTGFRNAGGDIYQTYLANNPHNTWDDMWNIRTMAGTFMTDLYWNNAHKAQPLLYYGSKQFCQGQPVSARMGLTPGYFAYEWEKDGSTIPGAIGNEYTATQTGSYRVRFMRVAGGKWSAWTPHPVVISSKSCTADTLYAEHFTNDNACNAAAPYTLGNFGCQNGIVTSGTSTFTQDAMGGQGNRFLVNFTHTDSGYKYSAGDTVWGNPKPISVTPNTVYEYSFFIGNQTDTTPAKLVPRINGVSLIADSASVTGTGNTSWKKFTYQWNAGNATTASLAIINKEFTTKGNDFAIDEISFRSTSVIPLPACVVNASPLNGSTVASPTAATLSWPSNPAASSYDVYIWSGITPSVSPTVTVTGNSYNDTALLPSTKYSWYIAPKNTSGAASGCANTGTTSFTTANPIVPVPGCAINNTPANSAAIATQTTATLGWDTVANAGSYDIYIWTGGVAPASPSANSTGNAYTATGLTPSTTYNWFVAPKNTSGTASGCANSSTSSFTTASVPVPPVVIPPVVIPGCAINNIPANSTIISTQTTATLGWDTVANAGSYDIYIWTGGVVPASPSANTTGNAYTATGLTPSTTYNWFVAPKNTGGTASGCANTSTSSFTTASVPVPPVITPPVAVPGCAINNIPANSTIISTQTTAILGWDTVANAGSYDIYIWTGGVAPASPTANTTGNTYTATGLTTSTIYNWFIAPKNTSGTASGCANTSASSFTTASVPVPPVVTPPVAVPGCAINNIPANSTIISTQTTAILGWDTVANAGSYDIYIWTGGVAPASPRANTTGNTYTATGLTPSTTYNWFIAPKNTSGTASGCANTSTSSFVTASVVVPPVVIPPVAVPGCAINNTPTNNAAIATQTTATLGWDTVANAGSYDIYIWTGGVVPASPSANTTANTYTATGLTPSTTYNWFIASKNTSGTASGCANTSTSSFTTASVPVPPVVIPPVVIPGCAINNIPANSTIISTQTTAILGWDTVANAGSYDIYIWTGSVVPASPTANTTGNTYTATGLTPSTTYNWFIAPKNTSGTASGCANTSASSFTTASVPVPPVVTPPVAVPGCAINNIPANSTIISTQTTATLGWDTVANAGSYDIYIWTGSVAPASPSANSTSNAYTATGLTPSTRYNWFVAPKNTSGTASGCANTSTSSFTTASVPVPPVITPPVVIPGCAINNIPANSTIISTQTTATLGWDTVTNAGSYDIYIWTGSVVPASPTANTTGNTYTATGLTPSTKYNWFVAPKNAGGAATGCRETNSTGFITAPSEPVPACVSNIAPVNGSIEVSQTSATLVWAATATATSYDVYIWKKDSAISSSITSIAGTSYTVTGLTPSTTYKWFIAPRNAIGAATGCAVTNTTNFSTALIPVPACVRNILPANSATIADQTTATLVWPATPTATSYDLYLWNGTTAPTTPTINVPSTSWNITGLKPGILYNWYVAPRNASGANPTCAASNITHFTTATAPNTPTDITGTGLHGDYFSHPDFSGEIILSRIDSIIDFDWGTRPPSNLINSNTFSVRWTGQVQPIFSETYTFYTFSNSGARLWVNGQLLIDNWKDYPATENSGTIKLIAGEKYDIKLEYYKGNDSAQAKLFWSGNSTPKQIIPRQQLFPYFNSNSSKNPDGNNQLPNGDGQGSVLTLYQNPVRPGQDATLKITSGKAIAAAVEVINIEGKVLLTAKLNIDKGEGLKTIPMNGMRPGIYIIHINSAGKKMSNLKLVIN